MNFTNSIADHFQQPFYSIVSPTPVPNPRIIGWSEEVAALLKIKQDSVWLEALAGNKILPGMQPIATRYAGHQFGHWAGQLGDGRAIILGEIDSQEIQLKGAGPTPYSRRADGRAVLRSSLREFLCSEAMFHLGIPTTRALALLTTGESVTRDMFYDGHPAAEPGAICVRVAKSFLRFGHFEMLASDGDQKTFRKLLDYVLAMYQTDRVEIFFAELCRRTAQLMSEWLRVGFIHAVMNTDNMSILGLTIDYGPYGWLDIYDPNFTPNTTDRDYKRYRFSAQPAIALWNLQRLADAFSALGEDVSAGLEIYKTEFNLSFQKMSADKLGLSEFDLSLSEELDQILQLQETDYTLFYRELAGSITTNQLKDCFYQQQSKEHQLRIENWLSVWRKKLPAETAQQISAKMNQVNPAFLVRNYLAFEATQDLEKNNFVKFNELMSALRRPYEKPSEEFYKKMPAWARQQPGCSALSCSS